MDFKAQWDVLATWIRAHSKDDRGASLVEYALGLHRGRQPAREFGLDQVQRARKRNQRLRLLT